VEEVSPFRTSALSQPSASLSKPSALFRSSLGMRLPRLPSLIRRMKIKISLPKSFLYAFVPQIFRTKIFHDPAPPSRLYPTSWIDGLRGLAALCVFNFHYLFAYTDMAARPWGSDSNHHWLIELPIIRLPYLGLPMVNTFFLAAGYVISLKPLQLMHSNTSSSREELLQTTCSSVFRRLWRLYLPVAASTLMVVFCTRLGLWEFMRIPITDRHLFPGTREKQLPRLDTLGQQLFLWLQEMSKITSIWEWKPFFPLHDPHLWSIAFEFRASLVLYLALILVARTKVYVRLGLLGALSIYCFRNDRYEIVLYFWGACLAQWDIIRAHRAPPSLPQTTNPVKEFDELPAVPDSESHPLPLSSRFFSSIIKTYLWKLAYGSLFFLSLWLFTAPTGGYTTAFGYQTLSYLIPSFWTRKEKFLPALGGILLMFLLSHCSPSSLAHRLLTNGTVQYLGKISFSLYLMHGPWLHLYGYYVPILVWKLVDREKVTGYVIGLIVGWAVNLAVSLCLADVFCREIDARCVKIAKWIEEKCFVR